VLINLEMSARSVPKEKLFQFSKLKRGSMGKYQAIGPTEEDSKG
jgi:hypothetical protein